ncbi:MAG: gamma-glutamyltransferase [Sandaracinaceae bacterium]
MARRGVVAAGDPQTARAGAETLRAGGSAVDAVCAAAFASFVCEPALTSPGGAGLLLHGAPGRGWSVLDFFARVPGLGGRPAALDFLAILVDFGATTQEFHVGRGAVAVPGALRGLLRAHRRHGRLPLDEVLGPARRLAVDGYVVSPNTAWTIGLLRPIFRMTAGARALVETGGRLAPGGARLRNPGQARLLDGLAHDADATLRAVDADLVEAFGQDRGGWIGPEDIARSEPVERPPLSVPFAGHTVLTAPPPSAGGGLVALGLRVAERSGLLRHPFGAHWGALAEVLRTVSDARARGYDARLDEPGYLDALLSDAAVDAAWAAREQAVTERALGGTTHISVLDGDAGAASLTMSNGEGSGHVLDDWGLHANNFLGEEDINPLGFHRQPPGAPMTTMMSPTVVLRGGRPVLVLGSGGSKRIRSAVVQGLVNRLGYGCALERAVGADRLHVEGDLLWFERAALPDMAASELASAWPKAVAFPDRNMFFGGVHAAEWHDGRYAGAGDPRRGGAVCTPEEV